MSLTRIKAVIAQELYITRHSLEIIIDLVFMTIINLLIFGFIMRYLLGAQNTAYFLLIGVILWEIVRINQYSVTVGSMWNIWSHNMSNMFIAPLSVSEYLIAHMTSGFLKTIVILIALMIISYYAFDFNLLQIGLNNLILHTINLTLFSWSMGILALGLVFRFGTRVQSISWSISYLFQPLTAAYFPLSILPEGIQKIALLFPATYVFEAARANFTDPTVNWEYFWIAFFQNIFYGIIAILFFAHLFNKSKETGQFARNDD